MDAYTGAKLTIRYCEQPLAGADEPPSWQEAMSHVLAGKRESLKAKMVARRQLLGERGHLRSPDHWNTEGVLPDGKRFYAIKADRIRAYGWFSTRHKGVFFISHFAFKSGRKLSAADEGRVVANWRRIEEVEP